MNVTGTNKRYLPAFIHILVWAVLFFLPYLLSSGQSFGLRRLAEHSWIPLVLYAVLFYLNYFILVNKLFFARKEWAYFAVNILIIAVFVGVKFFVRHYFFKPEDIMHRPPGTERPPVSIFIYIDAISLIIPVVFSMTIKIFERWITTEAEKKEAENARLESELQHLKYQLQPHFFFNSLNTIYALVDAAPDKARETILALSKLMRYLLYESNTVMVPLGKEVEFMQKYIELMQLRTSGNMVIESAFTGLPAEAKVAPLLFIPLIENAFKHGVSATGKGTIRFSMAMEGKTLVFESFNQCLPKNEGDRNGSGIGLQNIKKRLQLIYPGAYSFNAGADGGIYSAKLEIENILWP